MNLRAEAVKFKGSNKEKVKQIYTSSFCKKDRMPFFLMLMMAKMKSTEFLSFHDGDTLCGFVYMATINRLTFVMFFAVDENVRSKGYGSGILDKIQSLHPDNKIIITIKKCSGDAKDIEQRLRRKKFYLGNGYSDTGYLINLANQEQEILIKNGEFNKNQLFFFFIRYGLGGIIPNIWKPNPQNENAQKS